MITEEGENDARGWLFLKHLEVWRKFDADPTNPFHDRVDLGKIAIMGHSRGGEAVGHAAAFNRLSRYPDDASLTFDFGFDIRAVVAIAPVDGQYRPADRLVPLENVDYLVFHGTHDGDVTTFAGLRTWHRIRFTDGKPHFKAAVYVHRANHGQWNTVWGANDRGRRSSRILDLRGLLDPEDQRRIAVIYVTAFLEATLQGDDRYLPLFRDHRVAGGWLPRTMYVTQFRESSFRPVATFEEDIDVTSGTEPGVVIRGDSLATWKEGVLPFRYRREPSRTYTQRNHAVWIGWNNRIQGGDTTRLGPPAVYRILLPDSLPAAWGFGPGTTLELMLTGTDEVPGPREPPEGAREDVRAKAGEERTAGRREEPDRKEPLDLSVVVRDRGGREARLPLSRYGPVRRPIEVRIMRRKDQRYRRDFELVLQSYSIPLEDFRGVAPGLELEALTELRLLFDRTPAGTVVLDDVGFARMDPAFLKVSAARK